MKRYCRKIAGKVTWRRVTSRWRKLWMYDQGKRHVMVECIRQFLVHLKVYSDPSWIDEADLNYDAMLEEFERS